MGELGYGRALAEIERNALQCRVCFLQTEQPVMQIEVFKLLQRLVVPEFADFNVTRVHCSAQTGAGEIEAAAEELPIMAERRLVWVSELHLVTDEKQLKALAAYVAQAPPTTWLYLTAGKPKRDETAAGRGEAPKAARFKPLIEAVARVGLVIKDTMEQGEQSDWLKRHLRSLGLEADHAAHEKLIQSTNGDLAALLTESEKLYCYIGGPGRLTADDVETLVRNRETTLVYAITDACRKGKADALRTLDRLLVLEGQPAQVLLGMFASHYRKLTRVRSLLDAGTSSPDAIASATGLHPYAVKKGLLPQARELPLPVLERATEELLEADRLLKTRKRHERFILERLVLRLCDLSPTLPATAATTGASRR